MHVLRAQDTVRKLHNNAMLQVLEWKHVCVDKHVEADLCTSHRGGAGLAAVYQGCAASSKHSPIAHSRNVTPTQPAHVFELVRYERWVDLGRVGLLQYSFHCLVDAPHYSWRVCHHSQWAEGERCANFHEDLCWCCSLACPCATQVRAAPLVVQLWLDNAFLAGWCKREQVGAELVQGAIDSWGQQEEPGDFAGACWGVLEPGRQCWSTECGRGLELVWVLLWAL